MSVSEHVSAPQLGQRLTSRLDPIASAGALVFVTASLMPSLLPRSVPIQGALSAVSALIGYGLAGLMASLARRLARRAGRTSLAPSLRKWLHWMLVALWVLLIVGGPLLWLDWQNQQRPMVGLGPIGVRAAVNATLIALVLSAVMLAASRLVAGACGWLDRRLHGLGLPWLAAHFVVAVAAVLVGVLAVDQLVVKGVYASVDDSFRVGNSTTEPGISQPISPDVSGGPGSLTAWSTLGLQGRSFTGETTSIAALQRFAGPGVPVMQPIRVYAGLDSAPTAQARAELVVRELERTGAFSRKVLVVATATGTGWINPAAAAAVEYMWHGDSAIASIQYSYLPSWIGFLTERTSAQQAGQALIQAVYAHWSTLPAAHRPKLVIFGESLGSFGAESAFARSTAQDSVAALRSQSSGALFVGPTNANAVWGQVTAARAAGSPIWQPIFAPGGVHVALSPSEAGAPGAAAGQILYVQHASDPVTWWEPSLFWAPPAWVWSGHGPDVPASAGWFPIVTGLANSADLMAGFGAAVGHGHNYNNSFPSAFAAVTGPPGWTAADTTHLDQTIETIGDASGAS